jgi:hypothetical protein
VCQDCGSQIILKVLHADSVAEIAVLSAGPPTSVGTTACCLMLSHCGSAVMYRKETFSPGQIHCILLTQSLFCAKATEPGRGAESM